MGDSTPSHGGGGSGAAMEYDYLIKFLALGEWKSYISVSLSVCLFVSFFLALSTHLSCVCMYYKACVWVYVCIM